MRPSHIVVVGGGPVGAAFAIAASSLANVEVTLLERNADRPSLPPLGSFDHRVYALSQSTVALLQDIEVWSRMTAGRETPVDAMHVFGAAPAASALRQDPASAAFNEGDNQIRFHYGAPLAHIVEHAVLMDALYAVLAQSQVRLINGCAVEGITPSPDGQVLALSNGASLSAQLVVGADGRQSQVRQLVGISATEKDYESVGIVANFQCTRAHCNVAYQWFTDEGVLAYLPLPGNHISIVWSVSPKFAAALPEDPSGFADAVAAAGKHTLGQLRLTSARDAIALKRVLADRWVGQGFALIGDAAHAIHPLAGQGANLGFADAQTLVEVLASRHALARIGDLAVLRRYARARAEATAAMSQTTDHLQALFKRNDNVSKWLRSRGFSWFDQSGIAKRLVTEYAVQH